MAVFLFLNPNIFSIINKTNQKEINLQGFHYSPTPVPTTLPILSSSPISYSKTPLPRPQSNIFFFDVPFISQAPLAEWSNPIFQNACEETTLIMAQKWVENKTAPIDRNQARQEIIDISNYENEHYGTFSDLSVFDAVKLMKDYYNNINTEVKENITADDILNELEDGYIVIVPVDGRLLGNPNYTQPGPPEHMLLIKGYDYNTDEFITNDTGTRKGESYRYPKMILENAIREYPTGNHEPIPQIVKAMIVISR